MRLAKYISSAGISSRRAAEIFVREGRVKVDGAVNNDPAFDVTSENKVLFDSKEIKPPAQSDRRYIMFNKPVGVLSTFLPCKEEGVCLADLVNVDFRIHPVGRLDKDSSGLLLLTNDGEFTQKLTHPSQNIQKEYHLKTNRSLKRRDYYRLKKGIDVGGRRVEIDNLSSTKGGRLTVTIHEGRNRIVRRMFKEIGYRVIDLKRVRIGQVGIGKLAIGKWRYLKDSELDSFGLR